MKRSIAYVLVGVLACSPCFGEPTAATFKIKGDIIGLANDSVIVYINNVDNNGQRSRPDTFITKASKNKFELTGKIGGTRNAWALFGGYKSRKSVSFFVE